MPSPKSPLGTARSHRTDVDMTSSPNMLSPQKHADNILGHEKSNDDMNTSQSISLENVASTIDGDSAASNSEAADETDASAPPSDLGSFMQVDTVSPSRKTTFKSSVGPSSSPTTTQLRDLAVNDTQIQPNDDMANYDFSDTASVSTSTSVAELDLENDDDYEGVDRISNVSDDSLDFEKDVEADLEAEGDAVFSSIDWNDEQTYEYDENWNSGIYDLDHGSMESMADIVSSSPTAHNRMTQSMPTLPVRDLETLTSRANYPFSWTDTNSDASSTTQDTQVSNSPKIPSVDPFRPGYDDGEETESDEEVAALTPVTVSNPSSALRATKARPHKKRPLVRRTTLHTSVPSVRPKPREVRINPKKGIAFTFTGLFGRKMTRYIGPGGRRGWTPHASSRDSSASQSGASSPTMINFENAMMDGSTRSGAAITDAVNGAIFKFTHCPSTPAVHHDEPLMSSFYTPFIRPLLYSAPADTFGVDASGSVGVQFEDELIDFEQCDPPSTSATPVSVLESPTPSRNEMTQSSLNVKGKGRADSWPVAPTITGPVPFDTPMPDGNFVSEARPVTPSPIQMHETVTTNDNTSPRKRRLSDRSVTVPEINSSPLTKKHRAESIDVFV